MDTVCCLIHVIVMTDGLDLAAELVSINVHHTLSMWNLPLEFHILRIAMHQTYTELAIII